MLYVIIVIILIACVGAMIRTIKFKAARAKNYFVGQQGYCIECKNCVYDPTHSIVKGADYFCRLSKCENITESTMMNCCENAKREK